jgi:DNA-binding transcriptional ArsR family regulator
MPVKYDVEVQFEPIYELLNSVHTFICRKSYKKIDLGQQWAADTRSSLSQELVDRLNATELNNDWKTLNLLIYLCPYKESVESVLEWIEGLTVGGIYETLSEYITVFPVQMEDFRGKMLSLLREWNAQYFSRKGSDIIDRLQQHADRKKLELKASTLEAFINQTTNGFYFNPIDGLQKLVLIPQFHFQPANIIYHYGKLTICHYSARITLTEDEAISPFMYRTIRSLGEKSRLKILQSLSGERKTFTEIVKDAGISKGIVHDHIFNLRCAGLLYAYIDGENVTTYSLRLDGLHSMNEQLLAYLK